MNSTWTGPQVAEIVGITYDTLNYWVKKGLITPSGVSRGLRTRCRFSFSDIVIIAAIKALRDQGVSLQKLRCAQQELWHRIGVSLDQGLRGGVIVADRQYILAVVYSLNDAVQIMSLLKGGQMILPLDNIVDEMRCRTEEMFGQPANFTSAVVIEAGVANEH